MAMPDVISKDGQTYKLSNVVYHPNFRANVYFYEEVDDDIVVLIPQENVKVHFDGRKPCIESIWK